MPVHDQHFYGGSRRLGRRGPSPETRAQRASPLEPAKPSPSARAKAASKSTPGEMAVHSFRTLLAGLSTVVPYDLSIGNSESFKLTAALTPGQKGIRSPRRQSEEHVLKSWLAGLAELLSCQGKLAFLRREVQAGIPRFSCSRWTRFFRSAADLVVVPCAFHVG